MPSWRPSFYGNGSVRMMGSRMAFLMSAVIGATTSSSMREPPVLAPELLDELRDPKNLGSKGVILLMFRHVDQGQKWHSTHKLYKRGRDGDSFSESAATLVSLLMPELADDRSPVEVETRDASIKELVGWWRQARTSRSPTWTEFSHILTEPGWLGWKDKEHKRVTIDFYVENRSLCIASVIVARGEDADPKLADDFVEGVMKAAGSMANRATSHYWLLWEQRHRGDVLRRITDSTNVNPDEDEFHHRRFFARIASAMDPVVRAIAEAVHAPVAALFVPDLRQSTPSDEGIGLISHVGYCHPGSPFRFEPSYDGLTRVFCMSYAPQEQIPDRAALRAAYDDYGLAPPPQDPQIDQLDSSDRYLLRMLLEAGRPRGPLYGPWAYAAMAMSPRLWSIRTRDDAIANKHKGRKREKRGGVLKIQGRIPHEMDSPVHGPPRFATRELAFIQECSDLVALVFRRLVRAYAERFDRIVAEKLSIQHEDRGVPLDPFAEKLRKQLGARGVAMLVRDNSHASGFRSLGESWPESADHVREVLARDLQLWLDGEEDSEARGHLSTEGATLNRYYQTHSESGYVLAVVGVASELPLFEELASGTRCRDYSFPRLVEESLEKLAPAIRTVVEAVERSAMPPSNKVPADEDESNGHQADRAQLWKRITDRFGVKQPSRPRGYDEAVRRFLEGLAKRGGKQLDWAKYLGVGRTTLTSFLQKLGVRPASELLKCSTPAASEAELDAMLVELAKGLVPRGSIP